MAITTLWKRFQELEQRQLTLDLLELKKLVMITRKNSRTPLQRRW